MNTSPVQTLDEQEEEITTMTTGQKPTITQAETPEETLQPQSLETEDTSVKQADTTQDQDPASVQAQNMEENEVPDADDASNMQVKDGNTDSQVNGEQPDPDTPDDQTSRASQDNNYRTAIDNDEQDNTIQFGNPVTQPFLSRSVRVPITEVGCLNFTQMLQDYLQAYSPPTQADAYSQIQGMAQWLDVYLSKYLAQYINCMTSDSEFIAFINHTIQLALDLTTYPNIWAVLSILLETHHINASYMQTMHDYYNQCYDTRTQEYMVLLERAAEQSKTNMYNNTLDGVSAYIQQSVCNSPVQPSDQHDGNAENHIQLPYNAHFTDILTEYPAWSTDTNNIENTNQAQYRSDRQDILTAWQKDTPVKTPDNRQVLDNLEAYV